VEEVQTELLGEPVTGSQRGAGLFRFFIDIVETLLLAIILFVGINTLTARIRVDGSSMEPTLHNGEFVVVNRIIYRLFQPGQGDVIVFHYPRDPQQEYIKRVIGLPGDRVDIHDGRVYINGEVLDEPYIAASSAYQGSWIVPYENLFVLGDNRNNSSDSHSWGTVPLDYVIGKASLVYWPPPNWGLIAHVASAAR
jgi:signal peptidase I